jgi:hypothetical protein
LPRTGGIVVAVTGMYIQCGARGEGKMSATTERPELFTIGEVQRQLEVAGFGRSQTALRRLEERGVVRPFRTIGQDRRLYTAADIEALKAAIRGGHEPTAA